MARAVESSWTPAATVKRLGDGSWRCSVIRTASRCEPCSSPKMLQSLEVQGYTANAIGIHTGRLRRLAAAASEGVTSTSSARAMERATKGGIMISQMTLT